MNIKHVRTLKNGKRHVLVELDEGERIAGYHEDRYYKLGYPIEDIVEGRIIDEAVPVTWCSVEQRWAE
jgi:hypothetical protein